MQIAEQTLSRARRLDSQAAADLLLAAYPSIVRLARGLSGHEAPAARITAEVLRRCVRALPAWNQDLSPIQWFYHHTVLASREDRPAGAPADSDSLIVVAGSAAAASPPYVAFIAALRNLPFQQREAFILATGERISLRQAGVAMDCSVTAAATHLQAAEASLRQLAGPGFAALEAQFIQAYRALTPHDDSRVVPFVQRTVRAARWRRSAKRAARVLLIAALLALLIGLALRWRAFWV